MKALIIGLMSLLVVVAAVYSGSYLLPASCEVTRYVVVAATPEQVFPYIDNPTHWEKWNAWNKDYDPTMIRMYGGPMAGKGAYQQWNGDKLGDVQMHFTESTPPLILHYKQVTKGEPHETQGTFKLEPVRAGTKVVWQHKTALEDNAIARYRGYFKQKRLTQEAEQSLHALKIFVESTQKKSS